MARNPVLSIVAADIASKRPERVARHDQRLRAPIEGRGVHCQHGRLIGYGRGAKLVKHDTCGLSACPCPCHWGGQP